MVPTPATVLVALAALLATCQPVLAQDVLSVAPSAAVACLTPPAGARSKPTYPKQLLERKEGGTVDVEMTFRAPDEAPRVKVLHRSSTPDLMVSAVKEYLQEFRVPCMQPGDAPVTMLQSFSFDPVDGRQTFASGPVDRAETADREVFACLTQIAPAARPAYTTAAVRAGEQGRLLVQLKFDRPDEPPTMTVLAAPKGRYLRTAVQDFIAGYRLPCLKDKPVVGRQMFTFRIDGERRTVLKDVGLAAFVRAAKPVGGPVRFDLEQMGCPFDVRVTFLQPVESNLVQQLDNIDPRRAEFLEWLATLRLDVDAKTSNELLGDTMTVSVPCGKVDL